MPTHNNVPTTCTASFMTDWSIQGLNSKDPKVRNATRLRTVNGLINSGFKRDFSILHAITTEQQITNFGLDEFMPCIGFAPVFKGPKAKEGSQRHKETGDLTMWAVTPEDYETALKAYKIELEEEKLRVDPPKFIDPARQKFEDLLLSKLRKAGIVQDNASVDNPIHQVLLKDASVALRHLKMKYGFDPTKYHSDWTRMTTRQLKTHQQAWKNELV